MQTNHDNRPTTSKPTRRVRLVAAALAAMAAFGALNVAPSGAVGLHSDEGRCAIHAQSRDINRAMAQMARDRGDFSTAAIYESMVRADIAALAECLANPAPDRPWTLGELEATVHEIGGVALMR